MTPAARTRVDDESPHEWSVELLATTLSELIPEAKLALIGLNGRVDKIGDVMSALMLADHLTRALLCKTKNGTNTQERSPDS